MSIRQTTTGQAPPTRAPEPKKMDLWTNLSKIAKFASSYSKLTGVSPATMDFLKNMSEHLGAITSIEKLMSVDASPIDTLGKIGSLKSLRDVIAKDFTEVVESDLCKHLAKSENLIVKESFSLFKTAMSNIQAIDKEIAKPLSDLSKDLSVLPIYGHLDKLEKSADTLFVHPEEHRGETEEAAVSFASAALGVASVVLPLIMKVPPDVTNVMSAGSAFLGLVEHTQKSMLSPLEKEKRGAKDAIKKDFIKLESENAKYNREFCKSNPDHEYNKQFKAFHKGGAAKDIHDKHIAFPGMQYFYDDIDLAESSKDISNTLDEYMHYRGQLEVLGKDKESPALKTGEAVQKLRKKMDGPTA